MNILTWIPRVQELLHSDIGRYLYNPLAKALLKSEGPPLPNLYIKSTSPMLTWAYVNTLISIIINKDKHVSNLFENLHQESNYLHNNYMFVINTDSECIKTLKHIVQHKCLVADRHIVVLSIVEKLKHSLSLALSSLINKYTSTTLFIIVNHSNQFVPRFIYNNLFVVQLACKIETLKNDLKVPEHIMVPNNDPMNLCIILEYGQSETKIQDFIHKSLDNLVLSKGTLSYYAKLRDFVVKIGAGGVPPSILCNMIIKWKPCSETTELVAELDHALRLSNKEMFSLEHFFQKLTFT